LEVQNIGGDFFRQGSNFISQEISSFMLKRLSISTIALTSSILSPKIAKLQLYRKRRCSGRVLKVSTKDLFQQQLEE